MKINVNGVTRDMTDEELAQAEAVQAAEARRPLALEEVSTLLVREKVNDLDVDDQTALRMQDYYPRWEDLVGQIVEPSGVFRFTHDGKLYKLIPASHTFQADWIPGQGTESLYTRIDEEHAGTQADPIPYEGNMALTAGLYYAQDGVTYLCTRDTGSPVYNALSGLVGIYVEQI